MIKRMDEEAKASFEEMYLTYQDTLRRLAYAYDIPVDDIDDIIQDTFVSYARYDYSINQGCLLSPETPIFSRLFNI